MILRAANERPSGQASHFTLADERSHAVIKLNAGFSRKVGEPIHQEVLFDIPGMGVIASP